MNYCPLCGTPSYNSTAKFCTNCGGPLSNNNVNNDVNVNNNYNNPQPIVEEKNTFWWGVLGFFIPIAGLIIFLVWMKERPKSARSAGIGALIRTIITMILFIIFFFFAFFITIETNDENNNDNYRYRYPYAERYEENWSEYY